LADCELLKGCLFFNDKIPMDLGLGALYKKRYCQGDKLICARYMIATRLGRERVPANLHPNMLDQANEIIAKG
jgi:hypothetical protein